MSLPRWRRSARWVRQVPVRTWAWLGQSLTPRTLLVLAGVAVCIYALAILWYAQSLRDLGIRSAFTPVVKHIYPQYLVETPDRVAPHPDDLIIEVGNDVVAGWPDLVWAPIHLQEKLAAGEFRKGEPGRQGLRQQDGELHVRVRFRREAGDSGRPQEFTCWFRLGSLPLTEVVPSILWFFLKITLFVIGALVFWKRPNDRSATQFFIVCIVTLGAYMGGYHWSHIITQPALILGFMVCGVLLPVVSLHFYLIFPQPKGFLQRHPRWTLVAVYGLPLVFLAALVVGYACIRFRVGDMGTVLGLLRATVYAYLGVAALWYLACVVCLVHSFRTVTDATEHNQVKWILFGALAAVVPISYSFYLAVWRPDAFGGGAATWPMFAASVCFTIAFAVGITRYRLMQLDQLISASAIYFFISFLAVLVYYAVVFVFTLAQVIAGPSLTDALTVSTTALVLVLVLDLARSRVKRSLDRRFSKQKFQLDRTLQRMGEAIAQLVDPPTLAQRLLQASADLLSVPRGAVYLREGEPPLYRLAGCLGPPPPLTELSSGCPLIEDLQAGGAVVATHRRGQPVDAAQRQLRFLGGALAHALAHEGRLLALLVLGPKEHDEYRAEDVNLLAAFAQITVLALESAAGHRTIEGLNRDLQAKVEKISEQQRSILALQRQLRAQGTGNQGSGNQGSGNPGAGAKGVKGSDGGEGPEQEIIGCSGAVRHLLELVRKVSASEAAVLIRGESGTGKELLAKALHEHSPRAGKAFVKVNCAALSQGLLESELFGHVKGAYTGAHRDKVGRFELANGGTLFLDEIGDISMEVQTKLLRVLQEKTFERVGSSDPLQVDVRVIAATHQNLEQLIQQGRFREDLYYRLNVISIPVPPLRERREDVAELALHFLRQFARRAGKPVTQIEDEALVLLKAYRWPGNIRQLENAIARAVVVAEDAVITAADLPAELVGAVEGGDRWTRGANGNGDRPAAPQGIEAQRQEHDQHERERLVRALAAAEGNKARAARALGLARSTLLSRLKKHGLT